MKKLIGVILIIVSLVCIIAAVVEVAIGRIGMWSIWAVGACIFHALTMFAAVWLLPPAGGPPQETPAEGGA